MARKKKAEPTRPEGATDEGQFLLQRRLRTERGRGWKIVERFDTMDHAITFTEAQTDRDEYEYQVKVASPA